VPFDNVCNENFCRFLFSRLQRRFQFAPLERLLLRRRNDVTLKRQATLTKSDQEKARPPQGKFCSIFSNVSQVCVVIVNFKLLEVKFLILTVNL
jgi:hypothetical protein